jgi:addiction module HigA family antidote
MDDELDYDGGFARNIGIAFREVMQQIRLVDNENGLRNFKSLRFEKLKGKRRHEYSMRLNKQFRLIFQIEKADEHIRIVVTGIEDYHWTPRKDRAMAGEKTPIRYAVAPGRFIRKELAARGWSQRKLAAKMGRPYQAVNEIINEHKSITAETAIELGKAFGTPPAYWTHLQSDYELYKAAQKKRDAASVKSWRSLYPRA